MTKILFLANHFITLHAFRKELINSLIEQGYDVYLSIPESEDNIYFIQLGCKIIPTKIDRRGINPFKDLKLIKKYKEIICDVKPDVVCSYTIKPNIYGGWVCKRLKVPYITNITGLGTAVEGGGLLSKILLLFYKIALKDAAIVFFQNNENKDFMLNHKLIRSPYKVLPGSGVNLSENPFESYPSDCEKFFFVTIGRIMKDKGSDELIDAARKIKQHYNNVVFQMVGSFDGNYEGKISDAVADGTIEYLGYKKNIHDIIKHSNATIHPSYHEGMSNVLLESAACGRPVIASDVHGCRETFEDGISGIAFKPKSVDSIVEAVERFINLNYEEKVKMGFAGRKKVEREFDRRIVVDTYLAAIKMVEDNKNESL